MGAWGLQSCDETELIGLLLQRIDGGSRSGSGSASESGSSYRRSSQRMVEGTLQNRVSNLEIRLN